MKIFFCQIVYTYTADALVYYFEEEGHTVVSKFYSTPDDIYRDELTISMIENDIRTIRPDCVFSVNYYPVIAEASRACDMTYLAWSYDSPIDIDDKSSMLYPTNRVFLYDRIEYNRLKSEGYDTVFHLPLAADLRMTDRVKNVKRDKDISLVGKIYDSTFPVLREGMSDYTRGYLDSIIDSQKNILGWYMVPELVTDEVIQRVNDDFKMASDNAITVTKEQLWYSVATHITYMDRVTLLRVLSKLGNVHFYTYELSEKDTSLLQGVTIHGEVDYQKEMPGVFASSKINLQPFFRAIASGISLRVLDVISCGGFLLSSYQPELVESFIPGEEIVCYESIEDAYDKTAFYLKNEAERERIVENGKNRLRTDFSYQDRITRMLETV